MNGNTRTLMSVLFLALRIFRVAICHYTEYPPVKLLSVDSIADRYEASDSEYRQKIERCYDEDSGATDDDILNGFSTLCLVCEQDGHAYYLLPVKSDQTFVHIVPARKRNDGELYPNYCNKAELMIDVVNTGDNGQTSFECFSDPNDCSSKACTGNIADVVGDVQTGGQIWVRINTDPETQYTAAVWQISLSSSNDSSKLEGVFEEQAKARLSSLQTIPEFDTQLTMTSIVGGRGVGKSTVASLLSGNETMFVVGSETVGTTTTGADISTVMPAFDWASILSEKIHKDVTPPCTNLPMFLIDSEGMGVRGETFDFMTTSPPAIVSKVILWVYAGTFDTAEILYKIDDYLNGLQNIVLEGEIEVGGQVHCENPHYGYFIVIINKMVGNTPDEKMLETLMTPEPDHNDGYEERNTIRDKLRQCFEGVDVHGLPTLNINSGDEIDYKLLEEYPRFQTGLQKITNTIMQSACKPREVQVAGMSKALVANNSVSIIGTVIQESNKGEIDLTGFDSFWTFVQQDVESRMLLAEEKLSMFDEKCSFQSQPPHGYQCTDCICLFRNKSIDIQLSEIDLLLQMASMESIGFFDIDLKPYISTFRKETIDPWANKNHCYSMIDSNLHIPGKNIVQRDMNICDISQMEGELINPGQSVNIKCDFLIMCGTANFDAHEVTIETDAISIDTDTTLSNLKPSKANDGSNGIVPGERGSDGHDGLKAPPMMIYANYQLQESDESIKFISNGGDGGDGGNGMVGEDHTDEIPKGPTDARGVVETGTQYDNRKESLGHHCGEQCHTYAYISSYRYNLKYEACGGNGGNGGNAGVGGESTDIKIHIVDGIVNPEIIRNKGSNGNPGMGGDGAMGVLTDIDYYGDKREPEGAHCGGFLGWDCHVRIDDTSYENYHVVNHDTICNGNDGVSGS